jgi:hypothetical protein
MQLDRRQFLAISALPGWLGAGSSAAEATSPARISSRGDSVRVDASRYAFEWSSADDRFTFLDSKGRKMLSGVGQPAIMRRASGSAAASCSAGKISSKSVNGNRLIVTYEGVNQGAKVTVTWRFDGDNVWFEPLVYETSAPEDVVGVHYFSSVAEETPNPSLEHTYLIHPGMSESSSLSVVSLMMNGLDLTTWLGHGSGDLSANIQQWGLPTHYFCGVTSQVGLGVKGGMKEHLSDAFCCGLADLPAGDMLLELKGGRSSPVLNVRSDLWGQARGPGRITLGPTLCWAAGGDYRDSIRQYYSALVSAGIIRKKVNSAAKNAVVTAPQFNTWGAEVAIDKAWYKFDQGAIESIYSGLKASGMKPGMFVIDAKWEGKYGLLEHSAELFPRFEQFLQRVRSDGHKLGMWAAFMRCDDPQAVGLNVSHMLRQPNGQPIVKREVDKPYYLFDFSQAPVQEVLSGLARKYVKRYDPDLVKFDFGYELPSLSGGAPKDMNWAGERLLKKGLDVVVGAMREVKPDLVVMYYSLSPLFIDYFDLHSPDDLFMCVEDYHLEANKRFYFSSLLGEIGMPTYGSGGYDWPTMPDIWFDSAPMGTLGSLNSFAGDEQNTGPTPERVAKFNGLSQLLRRSNVFSVEPLDQVLYGGSNGARSSSWVRMERGEPVLVALRSHRFDGNGGPGGYKDVVRSTGSVVVASKSPGGLSSATRLGVVPYGSGELIIRHEGSAASAAVTTHRFGSTPLKSRLPLSGGILRVPLAERLTDGSVVEWLELDLS